MTIINLWKEYWPKLGIEPVTSFSQVMCATDLAMRLDTLNERENIVEKAENAGYQHFLLFPTCILPYQGQNFIIWAPPLSFRLQVLSVWIRLNFAVYYIVNSSLNDKTLDLSKLNDQSA